MDNELSEKLHSSRLKNGSIFLSLIERVIIEFNFISTIKLEI
jgi:hypothetical protein